MGGAIYNVSGARCNVGGVWALLTIGSVKHWVEIDGRHICCRSAIPFLFSQTSDQSNCRKEERLQRCKACGMSLLTAFHSWPGLLSLSNCRTNGLTSLLRSLRIPADPSQKILLETIFNIFLLKTPKWTDVFHDALLSCG